MLLSVEIPLVGAFVFRSARATLRHCMVWCTQSCRRRRTCANGQSRFPRNLGEPCSLLGELPAGDTGLPTPGPGGSLVRLGANQRVEPRYRQAKETKCGGTATGRRSTFIVPMKPGNQSRGTRWREGKTERGCLMLDSGPGTTSEASNLESRITVTTQDSTPGMRQFAVWRNHHQRNRML